jgi:hypothetical protein
MRPLRRSLLPFSWLLIGSAAADRNALQLIHEMQTALGGAPQLAAIRDFDESVSAKTWDRRGRPLGGVRKRVRWIRPNYLRIDQAGPYDTYVLFFDGRAGWEITPDRSVEDLSVKDLSVKELSGGELTFAQNYLRGLDLKIWLADRDGSDTVSSPAPNTLIVTPEAGRSLSTTITLDPVTHLPTRQGGTSYSDPDHPASAYTALDQWRVINGIKFPGRIRNFHEGRMLAEMTLHGMRVNIGIQTNVLSVKPPDLMPVMSGN